MKVSLGRAAAGMGQRWIATLLGTAALCVFSQGAFAQGSSAPVSLGAGQTAATAASEPGAETAGIETVTVTARRRAESLQKVPTAITAFSQATLTEHRVETLYDLMNYVPSANVSAYQNRDQQFITLRGQGETGFNTGGGVGGGPAVVGYLSDVPAPIAGPGLYYDLASVQVLAGPQGTLFGRNTTGGAILFEPVRPDYEFGGYAQLNVGTYGRIEGRGAVNVPLVDDKLAVRIAGQLGHVDGFTKDVARNTTYDNQNYHAVRFGALFQPSSHFENYFLANYVDYKNNGPGNILIAANGAINPSLLPYLAAQRARGIRHTELGVHELSQGRFLSLIDKTTYNITDNLSVHNIISYSTDQTRKQEDEDGTPLAVLDSLGSNRGGWNVNRGTFTEEFRLQGESLGGLLEWQGGVYHENTTSPGTETFTQQFGTFFVHSEARERSKSTGLYGHLILNLDSLLDGLKLSGGYRYTWDYVGFALGVTGGTGRYPLPADFCLIPAPTSCEDKAHSTSGGASYDIGLNYQVSPKTMVYVTARQGYKRGGFNMVAAELGDTNAFAYKPEFVNDVELGVKSDWSFLGMDARTDLSLYNSEYSDAQVLSAALVAGTVQGITVNAARATIRGLELQNTVVPSDNLEINLTYSYLDAHYGRYITPLGQDFTNTPYPYAPKNKIAAGVRYRLSAPSSAGDIWLGANYTYQSSTFVGITQFARGVSPANRAGAYGLLNLRLDWQHVLESPADVSIWATNVTDVQYETTVEDLYAATGASIATYGAPRMVGVTLRYSF